MDKFMHDVKLNLKAYKQLSNILTAAWIYDRGNLNAYKEYNENSKWTIIHQEEASLHNSIEKLVQAGFPGKNIKITVKEALAHATNKQLSR